MIPTPLQSTVRLLAGMACFAMTLGARAADPSTLSTAVLEQITALQAEKEARTPGQQKMDSQLIYKAKKHQGQKLGKGLAAMEERLVIAADGRETVDIDCSVSEALVADLKAAGAEIVAAVPRFHSIRARMPLGQIETFASRPEVRFIKPAVQARTHVGAKTSEGDAPHRADLVRSQLKATGRGLKVGIISDSIDSLAASQSTGDLGPVTVLPGQSGLNSGNSGEGTAMLEIVHDLAPDAELFFASAFLSEAQFAQNILDLRSAGCDIIVDDVGYFDESPLQDGAVAQAVDQVVASGALYFSAAGNEGNLNDGTSGVWEGDFVDGGVAGPLFAKGGRVHSFGPQTYDTITKSRGVATLFWSDPLGESHNDYDLYLLDAAGTTILASSTNSQNGSQDPYEIISTVANARLIVVKSAGAQSRFLHLNTLGGVLETSTSGTIQGHPAAAGAIAVAAVDANQSAPNPFTKANVVETFSTDGDRRIFYYSDGTPVTPGNLSSAGGQLRRKPDMAAADGVSTTVPGFLPFYGTSAAAPHAGAIAALVWSRNRQQTSQQVRAALAGTALDIEAAGVDHDSGAGLLDALAAAQSVPGGIIIQPGTLTRVGESFQPANNTVDPGETITVSLPLQNTGSLPTANLTATLLINGGVSNPSGPVSYGVLAPGASGTRTFTFQANGPIASVIMATFQFSDGSTYLGAFTANVPVGALGSQVTFSNTSAISIPSAGVATLYPSSIAVSGINNPVGKVSVTLNGFGHAYPSDVDILLVSPSGRKVILLSDAGGGTAVSGLNLTFDDSASGPASVPLVTGTFKPTAAGTSSLSSSLTAPAPAQPYTDTLSTFAGDPANGNWRLYVRDQAPPDSGTIATGWTLRITPVATPATNGPGPDLTPVLDQSTTLLTVGENVTYRVQVYNNGPAAADGVVLTDTLPATLVFGAASTTMGTVTNAGNVVTANIGTIGSRQSATVEIVATGLNSGLATNTVTVRTSGTDNNLANNTSNRTTLTVGQPNLTFIQPSGWAGALVISTVQGTNVEESHLTASTPLYADIAYTDNGTSPAHDYNRAQILVDGVILRTFNQQLDLAPGGMATFLDVALGTFPPGEHLLEVRLDVFNDVAESDETDNVLSRTFHIEGPNLTLVRPPEWTSGIVVSKITETNTDSPAFNTNDPIFVDWAVANQGELPTGASSTSKLYLDEVLLATLPISPLAAGEVNKVSDFPLGMLSAGPHTLRFVVDADSAIQETWETDNELIRTFVVNALPTITALSGQTLLEDGTTTALDFAIGDAETPGAQLTLSATSTNPLLVPVQNIALAGVDGNHTVQITPAPNLSGTAEITITVTDGSGGASSTTFAVTVVAVNDGPSFRRGLDQTTLEDSGLVNVPNWASTVSAGPSDEASQALVFLVSTDAPALFAVEPAIAADGTLTYTPASNAFGEARVTVRLQDNGGVQDGGVDVSGEQSFRLVVLPVNDAPSFMLGDAPARLQSAGAVSVAAFSTGISAGPANEEGQSLNFVVTSDHLEIFSTPPTISADGTLAYALSPSASGSATVAVRLQDSGGTLQGGVDTSPTQLFTIISQAVNDPPSFVIGPDIDVARDAGAQTLPHFATGLSAGPADEADQQLTFTVVADHPELFVRLPALSPDGTLTFAPALTGSGTAAVTVTLRDSGLSGDGNVNSSEPQTFLIRVTGLAEEAGVYNGLVQPATGGPQENARAGLVSIKITKTGAFTGKLTLLGKRNVLRGSFNNGGTARFGKFFAPSFLLKRKGQPTLLLTLNVDAGRGTNKLTGSLTKDGQPFATISADRALFTAKATAPPYQRVPAGLTGKYTVVFPAQTPAEQGLPASAYPQGDGIGSLSVSKKGVVKLVGSLADGRHISYANTLSQGLEWPLYVSLYRRRGSISGPVVFRDRPDVSDFDGQSLLWFKPASHSTLYPAGWPGGIATDLLGSHNTGQGLENLTPPDANGNAVATFSQAGQEVDFQKALSISPNGKVTVIPAAGDHLALKIRNSTGLVTGRFIAPATRRAGKIHGVVFGKQNSIFGYYLNAGASGGFEVKPIENPAGTSQADQPDPR